MKRIKKIVALIATFTTIFTSIPTMSFAESSSPSWIDDKGSVTPTNTELTFQAQWNDNNNENTKEARPTESDFSNGASLYFTLDGKKYKLSETTMKYLGMDNMPEISFSSSGSEHAIWSFKASLPTKITTVDPPTTTTKGDSDTKVDSDTKGDTSGSQSEDQSVDQSGDQSQSTEFETETVTPDPVDHDITWTMEYTYDEDNYIKSDETVSGNTYTTRFTLTTDYSGTVSWEDNGNLYESRPDFDSINYKVYRYTQGQSQSTAKEVTDAKIKAGDADSDGKVKLSLGKLPAYDSNGNPYIYYIDLGNDNIDATGDAGSYGIVYENADAYANNDTCIFPGGDATLTLEDTQEVVINKVWEDSDNDDRPSMNLYLYRIAENSNGNVTQSDIDKAGPVQNYDKEAVPTTDDDGNVLPDNQKIKITFGEGKTLPKYDSTGHRYVYFAAEYGSTDNYVASYDNSDSEYSDTVQNLATENNRVLDGGTITNERHGTIKTTATKTFNAKSMQQADVGVKYTLQIKEDGEWRYATTDDFADDYKLSDNENLSEDSDGHIVLEFSDFSAEKSSITLDGPSIKQYNKGKEKSYRWIETEFRIGTEWHKVPCNDPLAEDVTYPESNLGNIAPGIDGKNTTMRGTTTQDSNNEISNNLIGETQVLVTKTWTDNGTNVSASYETANLSATFDIYRNGESEPVKTVTLTQDDLNSSSDKWEKLIENLPRYDEYGREYTYTVKEHAVSGWSTTYTVSKSVVTDTSTANSGKDYLVPQTTYAYSNTKGPDSSLRFDVAKEWLDESDLTTRTPVTVSVYRLSDDKKTATKVDGSTRTLSDSNGWSTRIYINKQDDNDTVDNYIIREDTINGFEVSYSNDKSIYDIQDKSQTYSDDLVVGTAIESGTYEKIPYNYDVFIHRNSGKSGGSADYTISNRREGVINLHFTKTWKAGGTVITAGFTVYRSTRDDSEKTKVLTFQMPDDSTQDGVTVKENSNGTYTADISNLPKYDEQGNQYDYTVRETWLGDDSNLFTEDDNGNLCAKANGDDYISTAYEEHVDYAGATNHRTGDNYYWEGTNTRTSTYSLNAYKVWRDDGTKKNIKARPDVYFILYRISITDSDLEKYDNGADLANLCDSQLSAGKAETVKSDKLWNTKQNDWCWSCDLGKVDRYDDDGNRYIYFIKEGYSGSAGEYVDYYNNGTDKPNTGTVNSTVDVMDTSVNSDTITRNVTILSDGYNKGDSGYGDYYSRTVINTKENTRTLSGQKIWLLPSGYTIPDSELPEVSVSLYSTVQDIPDSVLNSYSDMSSAIKSGDYDLTYVNKVTIANGNNNFKFTTDSDGNELPKYNEYGQTYNYYAYEDTKPGVYDYSIKQTSANSFTITNTYNYGDKHVKIKVNKSWKSSLDSSQVDNMASANFDLYQIICDADGNQVTGTSPIKVASGTLESGETELTFDKITIGDGTGKELPLIGPNGKQVKYYVKETAVNGTTVTSGDGTSATNTIELTSNEDGTLYSGSVDFDNDYTGGNKDISLKKVWKDDTNAEDQDNSVYRPTKITLNIYRKWSANTVNGTKYDGGDESYKSVEVTGSADTKTTSWTYSEKNVTRYAPNGSEYTYYVKSETLGSPFDSYYVGSANGTDYNNTLKTRSYTVSKTWTNDETGNALTNDEINNLVKLGVLPSKVTFTLLREDSNNNEVSIATKDYTSSDYTNKDWKITWSGLPQTDTSGNPYYYRVKETIGDLTVYSDQIEAVNNTSTAASSVTGKIDKSSSYLGETGSATLNADKNNITFNNAIDMQKIKIVKAWDDSNNRDNTRPDSITVTIAGKDYTLKKIDGEDSWTLDNIYVPAVETDSFLETLKASESDIPGYKLVSTTYKDDTVTFTNKVNVDRVTIDITGEKVFKGDSNWTSVRPVVKLALQYQKQGSSEWVTVTDDNKSNVGLKGSGTQTVNIGSDGTGKVEWTGLYKYWSQTTSDGNPDPISYRVIEKCYATDSSTSQLDDTAYKVTSSEGDAIIVGKVEDSIKDGKVQKFSGTAKIENTLITTATSATKKWVDYNNEEGLRTPITMSLRANGTVVDTKVCNDDNNWSVSFTGLPKKDLYGKDIDYTVIESTPAGYINKTTGDVATGFTFTNTLKEETIAFTKYGLVNETCSTNKLYPADGTELLDGVEFTLYKTDGTKVATATSDKGVVKFTNVRNGHYYVQETDAPSPYKVSDAKYYVDVVHGISSGLYTTMGNSDSQIKDQTIIDDQARTSITINKVDENDGKTPIEGATYAIYRVVKSDDGDTPKYIEITRGKTDSKGKLTFDGLLTGTEYVIKEISPATGSYASKEPITFTVVDKDGQATITDFNGGDGTATFDVDTGTITWNEPIIETLINKVDENGDSLAGAKLEVIDKATGKTVDKWISTNEGHNIYGTLEAGKTYTLHEVKAPSGYDLAKDVDFTVPYKTYAHDESPIIKVTMVDKKVKNANVKTGDNFKLPILLGAMLVALAAIIALIATRKRKRK